MSLRRRSSLLSGAIFALVPVMVSGADVAQSHVRTDDSAKPSIVSLRVEPNLQDGGVQMRGRDARQQLFVTAEADSGRLLDRTHQAAWAVQPDGVARVDSGGLLVPVGDGDCVVTASTDGKSASLKVRVAEFAQEHRVNFKNQIVPIFTKLNCNGGGCHGKASGQNGFRLSLLGFYPNDDYEFLVKESRGGRRIFLPVPEESLLLTKPIGASPHGGGKRMGRESYEYRMMLRWIEQGMPYGSDDDPVVTGIRCLPDGRVMDSDGQQQITVLATYSDGSTEDVTRMSLYEPNDSEMAEVSTTGLVQTLDLAGEVAVMARYQGQVATFRATIPLGADTSDMPEPNNVVDEAVFAKLRLLGIPPSDVCDDSTFLRRVSIDIAGRLPEEAEVRAFLADTDPKKRDKLIDRLLDSPHYADYFANKWNMVLRNKRERNEDRPGTFAFHQWIWNSLYENKPYDQFVRDIITASGDAEFNPPAAWYREVDQTDEQVEDTAQLFLGMRIQCARCHHHPYEKWSQNDYYGLAAFFSRVGKKTIPGANRNVRDRRIYHREGVAAAKNPRNDAQLKPTGLGQPAAFTIPAERDPRVWLADWMADRDNPFFAPSLVNRYWKHFFSRGIVEPEDDMRATNPPTNPELLAGLSERFVESGFDLKDLIRTICRSKTYQLSSLPNDFNAKDKQNFSRYYPRRLTAETLYDGFHQVTGAVQQFSGLPVGMRATQLPDASVGPYFLKVFGQPQGDTACECERSQEANLAQSLHLLNSKEVQSKIAADSGRARSFSRDAKRSTEDKLKELYRWAYSRHPDGEEFAIAKAYIEGRKPDQRDAAWEDVVWALINTKEFLFNH